MQISATKRSRRWAIPTCLLGKVIVKTQYPCVVFDTVLKNEEKLTTKLRYFFVPFSYKKCPHLRYENLPPLAQNFFQKTVA